MYGPHPRQARDECTTYYVSARGVISRILYVLRSSYAIMSRLSHQTDLPGKLPDSDDPRQDGPVCARKIYGTVTRLTQLGGLS